MSPQFHPKAGQILLAAVLVLSGSLLQAAGEDTGTEPDSLEALLAETEAMVEGPLPFEDGMIEEEPAETVFLAIGSVQSGPGYSGNYLKSTEAVESAYLHLEADAWLGWMAETWSASGFIFAESNIYEEETEYLTLAQFTGRISRGPFDLGSEALVIYGEQVFDSSLYDINSIPTGTLIEEFLPELSLFVDWFASDRNRIRLQPAIRRLEFDIEKQDYWEPAVKLEWEHLWHPTLRTETRLELAREIYDDQESLLGTWYPVGDSSLLEVDKLELEQEFKWEPGKWVELKVLAGLSRDWDRYGDFKDLRRYWGGAEVRLRSAWGDLTLTGRFLEMDYLYRQAEPGAATPLARQSQWFTRLEYEKSLPWDLILHLKLSRIEVDSRTRFESYLEERGEIVLEWHY